MLSATSERITHMSSTHVEICGSNSLTAVPAWPYCLNDHGDPSRLPVFVRSSFGFSNGNGLPMSFVSRGFGANKTTCDGPPDMNRKIMRFALAAYGGGLTSRGVAVALSAKTVETMSSASNPARPSMPKPLANRRNICRRLTGVCQPLLECELNTLGILPQTI